MTSLAGYVDSREVHLSKVAQQHGLEMTMRARRKVQRGTKLITLACIAVAVIWRATKEDRVGTVGDGGSYYYESNQAVYLLSISLSDYLFFFSDLDGYNCSFIPQSRLGILNPTYKIFVRDCIYSEDMLEKVKQWFPNRISYMVS